jgi:hypothetical protein
VPLAVALLALAVCADQLTRPHSLHGIYGYDDGVYLGVSVRLVHGVLPYRDFAFAQPPGMALLLAPLAFLARWTGTRALVAEGRVLTAFVASTNVFLLARLVRHRGMAAMLAAGAILAFFPLAVAADKTVELEPYLVLFCVIGVGLMFVGGEVTDSRRRLLLAGLSFGLAGTFKVWAIMPIVVALACCAPRLRERGGPLLAGVTAGFVVPTLAFFVAAPERFIRDVVLIQLERSGASLASLPVGERLVFMTGVRGMPGILPSVHHAAEVAGFSGVLVVAAFALGRPRRPAPLEWFALGTAGAGILALLLVQNFYDHHTYYTAAFVSLVLALSLARLVETALRWHERWPGAVASRLLSLAPGVAVAVLVAGTAFGLRESWYLIRRPEPNFLLEGGDPARQIDRAVPAGACVVTDSPFLTIASDRFVSHGSRCPNTDDPFYEWLEIDHSHPPPSAGPYAQRLVDEWRRWFEVANYVVLTKRPYRVPWTPGLRSWFRAHFDLESTGADADVYRNKARFRVGRR